MKYQSIMLAGAFACSGLAGAAGDNSSVSKDEMADFHIECLEAAYGDELEGDQVDIYVKECVQQKLAKRKGTDKNA
jgi:hypothetical protein